jgi:SAM-dependent methyltransferase
MNQREHWEDVYRTKGDTELSWFQSEPGISLSLIEALDDLPRRAIDMGGGQSSLAGELLRLGVEDVAVLDISQAAIERGQDRLGDDAARVQWIAADVLDPPDLGEFDLWHDRAVYHFLTNAADRERYLRVAAAAVAPGGHLIVATFAPTGPEKCSGLPVHRCDAEQLREEFKPLFSLVRSQPETHLTPWGKPQDFTYAVFRRLG